MDGMLSQEEINALLNGVMPDVTIDNDNKGNDNELKLTDIEKDAIGEISNISMGTAATTLSSLVNRKVIITTPVVTYSTWKDIVNSNDRPCVFIQIYYQDGLDGNNVLILKDKDVKIIADLMMGGDGANTDGELTELHLSAISEAMNQMMGSSATSVSTMLNKSINITPPTSQLVDFEKNIIEGEKIADFLKSKFVQVSFRMQIEDLVDSVLMQLYPFEFAKELYDQFIAASNPAEEPQYASTPTAAPAEMPQMSNDFDMNMMAEAFTNHIPSQQQAVQYTMPPIQDVNVQSAKFVPFTPTTIQKAAPENIDLLMDVSLEVVAELGKTTKSIKEILDFGPGTIVELNRLVGEPIDIVVSGKIVAKGEVVVIEEAFGVRITEIIKS